MEIKKISPFVSVSPQIYPAHMERLAAMGFKTLINNRPEKEADDQPLLEDLEAEAEKHGMRLISIPVIPGAITEQNVEDFSLEMGRVQGPVLVYCRSGMRSTSLWARYEARHMDPDALITFASSIGYDLGPQKEALEEFAQKAAGEPEPVYHQSVVESHDVVIVGGGSAGLAVAASLHRRRPGLDIVVIEPRYKHFYQPGFTMVGAGVFDALKTQAFTRDVIPAGVRWMEAAVASFSPDKNQITLEDGGRVGYRQLVVAAGLKLDWDAVEGLQESLGHNGVTSNYRFDYAPYTWQLVKNLEAGRALFTQPPMPVKGSGAALKALFLSCDHWLRRNVLKDIDVTFASAGGALFDIEHFVPPLMEYVSKYNAGLSLFHNLVAVDAEAKKAWFEIAEPGTDVRREVLDFDMLHVCPPQTAPDFIRKSPLANEAGWVDVTRDTLRHTSYENVFSLGDVCSAPNAKTLAAARLQAPVVAENLLAVMDGKEPAVGYNGYGSCPLTVERGKIVLAEFGYDGELLPTFPQWLIKSDQPGKLAWFLKEKMLPTVYYQLMLKGREWLAKPERLERS